MISHIYCAHDHEDESHHNSATWVLAVACFQRYLRKRPNLTYCFAPVHWQDKTLSQNSLGGSALPTQSFLPLTFILTQFLNHGM